MDKLNQSVEKRSLFGKFKAMARKQGGTKTPIQAQNFQICLSDDNGETVRRVKLLPEHNIEICLSSENGKTVRQVEVVQEENKDDGDDDGDDDAQESTSDEYTYEYSDEGEEADREEDDANADAEEDADADAEEAEKKISQRSNCAKPVLPRKDVRRDPPTAVSKRYTERRSASFARIRPAIEKQRP